MSKSTQLRRTSLPVLPIGQRWMFQPEKEERLAAARRTLQIMEFNLYTAIADYEGVESVNYYARQVGQAKFNLIRWQQLAASTSPIIIKEEF